MTGRSTPACRWHGSTRARGRVDRSRRSRTVRTVVRLSDGPPRLPRHRVRGQGAGRGHAAVRHPRLPASARVLDAEIERILDLGVELQLNTGVGRDISLEELQCRHATVYLGIGAQMGRGLGIPGEEGPSVWTGTDYLARVNCGEPVDLGGRVVVVGGGNTAVDAARTARRTGAEVTILYRRSRDEMPAIAEEIDDALEEGIELVLLAAPVRIERLPNGRLAELVACRMELGEPDESGRRRPIPIPDPTTRSRRLRDRGRLAGPDPRGLRGPRPGRQLAPDRRGRTTGSSPGATRSASGSPVTRSCRAAGRPRSCTRGCANCLRPR